MNSIRLYFLFLVYDGIRERGFNTQKNDKNFTSKYQGYDVFEVKLFFLKFSWNFL